MSSAAPLPDDPSTSAPDDGPDGGAGGPGEVADRAVETVVEAIGEVASGPAPAWSDEVTGHLSGFDETVDGLFDRYLRGRPAVDRVMYSVTELADFSLLWHLLGATRGLRSDADAAAAVRLSAVLGVESTLVNAGLKQLFKRERPVPDFERPHHLRIPITTSFPSGHASAAMCAATLLSDGRGRAATAGWFGLAALVASSRVHVKIHHASDVIGGMVVGLAVGQVAKRAWRLRRR